jgi:3-oxoadipate enol-lactonase
MPYDSAMPFVRVRDINVYYELQGEGPRLLYISGTGGDLRNSPRVFDGPLPRHFEVLAYDQRGLGQTDKPDIEYTMADYADDAAGLMDALGWRRVFVVGVSFGGMVAQELALRHPERIEKLVLCCTSSGGPGGASYPLHEIEHLPYEEQARIRIPITDARKDTAWQAAHPDETKQLVATAIATSESRHRDPAAAMGYRRQLEARAAHDTYARLGALSMPVLLAGGLYDRQAPPENMETLKRCIPGSRLEFFEGGHGFLRDDPRAVERIVAFLKSEQPD